VELRCSVLPLEPFYEFLARVGCRLGLGGGLGDLGGDTSNRRDRGLPLMSPRVDNAIYPPNMLECKFCCLLTGFDLKLKVFERDDGNRDI